MYKAAAHGIHEAVKVLRHGKVVGVVKRQRLVNLDGLLVNGAVALNPKP